MVASAIFTVQLIDNVCNSPSDECPRRAYTEDILHHLPHVPAVLKREVAQLATGLCNLHLNVLHGLGEPGLVHHQLTVHHVCKAPCALQIADTPHVHVDRTTPGEDQPQLTVDVVTSMIQERRYTSTNNVRAASQEFR